MKLVIIIACGLAVVFAAPKPEQYEDERQQQYRSRLQGLRLRLADIEPIKKHEQKYDRYYDREDDYLRKIVQRGNQAVAVYPRAHQQHQSYHDLGSLNFRYYSPSQPLGYSSSLPLAYSSGQSLGGPVPVNTVRGRHEDNQAYRQNYYRESYLREQDQDREDDDEEQD